MGEAKYYTDASKESRKRATIKYTKEHRKRVELNLATDQYERWKSAADEQGKPLGTFIRDAVEEKIKE